MQDSGLRCSLVEDIVARTSREGDFGEWFQHFWGGVRPGLDCIFAICR